MTSLAFNSFLVVLLFVPAVTLVSRWWNGARLFASLMLLTATLFGGAIGAACWWRGIRVAVDLSAFAPVPFALMIDRLSAFFLLLISAVSAPVILFSLSYIERHYDGARRVWLWALLPWFLL